MDCATRLFCPWPLRRLAGLTAGLLAALCFTAPTPAQDSPALDTIRAGYIQTLSAIQTLDCRFELVQTAGPAPAPVPGRADASRTYTHYDVTYRTDGARFASLTQLAFAPGETRHRRWTAFDGKTYSSWSEQIEPDLTRPYHAPSGTLSPERTGLSGWPVSLQTLTGQTFWGEKGQLRDLFTTAVNPVVAPDAVDGVDCLRVDFGEHPGPVTVLEPAVRYRTRVWFDPAAGYLPRRVRSESEYGGTAPFFDFHVTSFLKVKDPLSGGELSLPAAARHERPQVIYEFKLLSATVNQDLPAALFTPDFPQGTRVTDRAKSGDARTWLVGSPDLREQLETRERATWPQLTATSIPAGTPRPAQPTPPYILEYPSQIDDRITSTALNVEREFYLVSLEKPGAPDWLQSVTSSDDRFEATLSRVRFPDGDRSMVLSGHFEKRRYQCVVKTRLPMTAEARAGTQLRFAQNGPRVMVSLTRRLAVQAVPSELLVPVPAKDSEVRRTVTLVSTRETPLEITRITSPAEWLTVAHERLSDNRVRLDVVVDRQRIPKEAAARSGIVEIVTSGSDGLTVSLPVTVRLD